MAHAVRLCPELIVVRPNFPAYRAASKQVGVWIEEAPPQPEHWHDRLAARFGYPRLSCQITVTHDLLVRLVMDKRIWGRRDATRRWPSREGA